MNFVDTYYQAWQKAREKANLCMYCDANLDKHGIENEKGQVLCEKCNSVQIKNYENI